MDHNLTVTEVQRFCMHDGPGVRTTVFLKGCPLRCKWCHNPETQKRERELLFYPSKCILCHSCGSACSRDVHRFGADHTLARQSCAACGDCIRVCPTCALDLCGKDYTVDELLSVIERDRAFYADTGGVTLSGGEPLLQKEGALALLKAAKERGLSTAVETCGYVDTDTVLSAVPYTDLFLWDVKDTNDMRHQEYTGVSNRRILENLMKADALGARIRLRCILVNGVNTDEAHYRELAGIAASLSACEGVELIPYHAYGGTKSTFIGLPDSGVPEWIPQEEELDRAKELLRRYEIHVL